MGPIKLTKKEKALEEIKKKAYNEGYIAGQRSALQQYEESLRLGNHILEIIDKKVRFHQCM